MKIAPAEAAQALHVPAGVMRLAGAAKEIMNMYRIQTMNKISPVGLNRFPSELYEVSDTVQDPQGILVRSAKLLDMEFNPGLLAIARAAVADPPVMILDEATSSIDTRTEALIAQGMDALMEGRTVFVIAHRLSTVRNSDCIVVIEHGESE